MTLYSPLSLCVCNYLGAGDGLEVADHVGHHALGGRGVHTLVVVTAVVVAAVVLSCTTHSFMSVHGTNFRVKMRGQRLTFQCLRLMSSTDTKGALGSCSQEPNNTGS